MDPDQAIKNALAACEHFHNGERGDTDFAAFDRLVTAFEALDQWLSQGGYLPRAWARSPGEIAKEPREAVDPGVIRITAEDIEAMQARERELEATIAEDQRRLTETRDWLRAVDLLAVTRALPVSVGFSGVLERIANTSHAPIAKANLKTMLANEGFAEESLAQYFYTVIHRLKVKKRITVNSDGSVWRAPTINQDAGGNPPASEPRSVESL